MSCYPDQSTDLDAISPLNEAAAATRRDSSTAAIDARRQRLQEKNRRTQRAYRARQKERIEALSEENERLRAEVAELQYKLNEATTCCDALREHAANLEACTAAHAAQLQCKYREIGQLQLALKQAKSNSGAESSISVHPGRREADTVVLQTDEAIVLDAEKLEAMPVEKMIVEARKFLVEMAAAYRMYQNVPTSAKAQRDLAIATSKMQSIWQQGFKAAPLKARQSVLQQRKDLSLSDSETRAVNSRVLHAMALTQQQRVATAAAWHDYKDRLAAANARRAAVGRHVAASLANPTTDTNSYAAYVATADACDDLSNVLHSENDVRLRLHDAISTIWSPPQFAHVMLGAMPLMSDAIFVCALVAEECAVHATLRRQPCLPCCDDGVTAMTAGRAAAQQAKHGTQQTQNMQQSNTACAEPPSTNRNLNTNHHPLFFAGDMDANLGNELNNVEFMFGNDDVVPDSLLPSISGLSDVLGDDLLALCGAESSFENILGF